jgi:hypothetical protein
MTRIDRTVTTLALVLLGAAPAFAQQGSASTHASGGGNADIELGANQPSQVEMGAGSSGGAHAHMGRVHGSDDPRLGVQLRLDALNMLSFSVPGANGQVAGDGWRLFVPTVTPGVRFLENKLFLGLGLGLAGVKVSNGNNESSRSGWSLSPLASYDVLTDAMGAFSLLGWLNLAHLGESETCINNNCNTANNDILGWGVGLGAGLRGFITQGLALGGEFGWSFLSLPQDNGPDTFIHGLFGNIFLEASVGI